MKTQLILGDCLDKLKDLEADSVDSIVTDPPYGLSFMGKKWDYDVPSQAIWEECMRVLKPGGHLLSFAGSRTYHRMAVRIEDAGFEIRDQIMWIYGSGFPKSHNVGHKLGEEYKGMGTALKPAHEPIVMARKPFKGTVADNVLEWGTGGINIDGCRIGTYDTFGGGAKATKIFDGDAGYNGDGWKAGNEAGRFPANIIFDEEAGKILDEQSGKLNKQAKCKTDNKSGWQNEYVGGNEVNPVERKLYLDEGGASRFFYCPKASKKDRDEGMPEKVGVFIQRPRREDGSVIYKETHPEEWAEAMKGKHRSEKTSKAAAEELLQDDKSATRNIHPTVKPTDLMGYLIRLVTPKGGVVLDPFTGSGSTGKAAVREGMNFIGIEREEEYFHIAKQRIEWEVSKKPNNKFWE
jgi:site-specific DNA-methyltransferase (adenine-specific)